MPDDLYREICRNPGDDTLRLAYADWLDEQPTSRPCTQCEGTGYGVKTGAYSWRVCDCGGTGSVADTGNRDRAEFIRSRILGHPPDRANALLAAHPEWSRSPCLGCEGSGRVLGPSVYGYSREREPCECCAGTGDLFFTPGVSGASLTPPPKPRSVTFARGFPDAVSCTLAEAFTEDGTPTAWACEVVRRTPVTRFVLADKTPFSLADELLPLRWLRCDGTDSPAMLPDYLFDEIPGNGPTVEYDHWGRFYALELAAVDALALAAGRLVRKHVYGEVTQ